MTRFKRGVRKRQSIRLRGYDYGRRGAYFITICTKNMAHYFGSVIDGRMVLNEFGQIAYSCWLAIPGHFPHVELDEFVVMPNHVHGIVWIANDPRRVDERRGPGQNNRGGETRGPGHDDRGGETRGPRHDDRGGKTRGPRHDDRRGEKFFAPTVTYVPPATSGSHDAPTRNVNPTTTPPRAENTTAFRSPEKTVGSVVRGYKIGVTNWARKHTDVYDIWQRNYYERIVRDQHALKQIRQYIAQNPAKWNNAVGAKNFSPWNFSPR